MSEEIVRPRSPRARSTAPDKARAVRKDPRRSHIDGMREGHLSGDGYRPIGSNGGKDEYHYVYVNKATRLHGVEYYRMLGYRHVTKDDGVSITGRGSDEGNSTDLEFYGMALMCCPRERYEEIVQYGPGGDTGLANTARIEKQIIRRQSLGRDSLRGMGDGGGFPSREHLRITDHGPAPEMDQEEA